MLWNKNRFKSIFSKKSELRSINDYAFSGTLIREIEIPLSVY